MQLPSNFRSHSRTVRRESTLFIGLLAAAFFGWIPTATSTARAAGLASEAGGTDFFENRIRPILVEHCYSCHSAQSEKVRGGLLLDTREGLLKGGETGPAIVPGDPEKSLLIRAVRYADEHLHMPPKGQRLSPDQVADLESWIRLGAPDPRTSRGGVTSGPTASAAHWAFQPVRPPAIPAVKDSAWIQSPIDAFVLAALESKGLTPSATADRRTLIRRASFDLLGLPPPPEEVAEFLADQSADAMAKVVDRLLASPRFGERWGRHWLDVARYADTKGYVFEEERRYPYSYTYRDYVIRAFNEDLPYNRFVVEQIAADLLPLGEDKRPLAALGFLTLGRRFLNDPHDIIDDRIDVVTRGMMGLTVTCARCHDHKFDPVPSQDYYSLYGVFASCSEPSEKPLLGPNVSSKLFAEYLTEQKKRAEELQAFQETEEAKALSQVRQRSGDYLLAAYEAQRLANGERVEGLARERKLHPGTVRRWMANLADRSKSVHDPIFAPWFAFAKLPEKEFAAQAKEVALRLTVGPVSTHRLNALIAWAFAGDPPGSMKEVAERYGKVFADLEKRWRETTAARKPEPAVGTGGIPASATAFTDPSLEECRQVLYGAESPTQVPASEIVRLFDVPIGQKVRALRRKVDELDATHPGAPPRAMALQDNATPSNPRVFQRGNPNNPGPEVPRQFLHVVAGEKRRPFQKGSGRLELAEAIASRDNPLTARVMVNRVWMHYFGAGLVRTPSDFGVRSDPPSHPELLDHLAWQFMEEGWSLKKLHRRIMLSHVYQQATDDHPRSAQIDPNNLLLGRMSRRRLDFEATRDTLLATVGQLDLHSGGRAVDITTEPFPTRRTVYGFIERQNLPGLFRVFDFASPDTTNPQRFLTTVPQQALFMLNSPFVVQQARQFLERPEFRAGGKTEDRVRALYQTAYQRDPTPEEVDLARRFIQSQTAASGALVDSPVGPTGSGSASGTVAVVGKAKPNSSSPKETVHPLSAWEKYAQVLLMSNELVFVD